MKTMVNSQIDIYFSFTLTQRSMTMMSTWIDVIHIVQHKHSHTNKIYYLFFFYTDENRKKKKKFDNNMLIIEKNLSLLVTYTSLITVSWVLKLNTKWNKKKKIIKRWLIFYLQYQTKWPIRILCTKQDEREIRNSSHHHVHPMCCVCVCVCIARGIQHVTFDFCLCFFFGFHYVSALCFTSFFFYMYIRTI